MAKESNSEYASHHANIASHPDYRQLLEDVVSRAGIVELMKAAQNSDKKPVFLDVGGGIGVLGRVLAKVAKKNGIPHSTVSPAFTYINVDNDEEALKQSPPQTHLGSVNELPIPEKSADAIFLIAANAILTEEALSSIYAAAKPGAKFVAVEFVLKEKLEEKGKKDEPYPGTRFTAKEIIKIPPKLAAAYATFQRAIPTHARVVIGERILK